MSELKRKMDISKKDKKDIYASRKPDYLFEASWEVCNKVGGIYTVVRSKAPIMMEQYQNYFMIGPYFENKARLELEKVQPPSPIKKAFDALESKGVKCHYGTWKIDGSPKTILIDFSGLINEKNDIKASLWESNKIDSMKSGWEFEEPMLWSWAVGMLLKEIEKIIPSKKIVGQFHEWMSGFAIFYLKDFSSSVGTVFTTHATMLGRTLSGNGEDLYNILDKIDPIQKAYQYNVQDKVLAERACAQNADIFTTVSEITAIEAEKILGRKPEVILNNGLTIQNFPTIEETSIKHSITKKLVREFLTYYFYPYYNIDLDHNLTFFIVGRYEYKNKGIDVLIKALGKLNERLKKENTTRTISAFFWIPSGVNRLNTDLLENKNYFKHIKTYVYANSNKILDSIISDIVMRIPLSSKNIFTKEFLKNLEKDIEVFKRPGNPPVCTHYLMNPDNDSITQEFNRQGLDNQEDDKVKVIFYPVYLTGADGLLDLSYYDALSASHLGIFPSYYEPWGYTPVEAAALGVPSITTDLAGFGRFIEPNIPTKGLKGIQVLKRLNRSDDEVVEDLYNMLYEFAMLNHEERVKNKLIAKGLANLTDWTNFVHNYLEAHSLAIEKK